MLNTSSMVMPRQLSTTQKAARRIIFQCLQKMETGTLTVIESFHTESRERSERFGTTGNDHSGANVVATIEVKHRLLLACVTRWQYCCRRSLHGRLVGQPDLTALMKLMALNLAALDGLEEQSSWLSKLVYKMAHWANRNTQQNSKRTFMRTTILVTISIVLF